MGQIAGKMSKTGIIGYIGSFPIPEVVMGINSFMLGAQSVNPDVKIKIVWVNSWYDPGKEADAAKALLDQGADIIAQHTDSPAPLQTAEARGMHGFGQASDMIASPRRRSSPRSSTTGATITSQRTKAVLDGTWKSGDTWGGLAAGHGRDGALHEHARRREGDGRGDRGQDQVRQAQSLQVPDRKQDGSASNARARRARRRQVLGMNWYVKGIDDKLPQ